MKARGLGRIAYDFCLKFLILFGSSLAAPAGQASPYSVVLVEEMLGRVTIVDSADPARRVSVPVGFKPHEIVVSPDGTTAFVSNFGLNDADNRDGIAGQSVSAIDIGSATVRYEFHLPDQLKAPHGLGMRPHRHAELFTNAEQGDQMVVFDSNDGHVKRAFPLPEGIHNFIFSKSGTEIFAFAPRGSVFRLNADSGRVQAARDLGRPVRGLAWTADKQHLLASVRGAIAMLDPGTLATTKEFKGPDATQFFYTAATPDGRLILAPAVFSAEVTVFDARDGAVVQHIAAETPLRVVLSPDASLAYVANVSPRGDEVSVIHLSGFQVTHVTGLRDVNGLAISPILPTALSAR